MDFLARRTLTVTRATFQLPDAMLYDINASGGFGGRRHRSPGSSDDFMYICMIGSLALVARSMSLSPRWVRRETPLGVGGTHRWSQTLLLLLLKESCLLPNDDAHD